jgi:GT2 family glycosyltransferase
MNVTAIPQISVMMPVHNALPFLDESIRSILEQTLTNFEFVILDAPNQTSFIDEKNAPAN